jgi:hypothetical protein
MQDLDSFILLIPGFEGDISIPTTLVSAHDPIIKSSQGPSIGSGTGASRTWASKQRAPIAASYPKKSKKAPGKPPGRIKIPILNPKDPASTPPSRTQKGIPILRLKRCIHSASLASFHAECLKISIRPHLQRALRPRASPQRWTSPQVLLLERPSRQCGSPRAQKTLMSQLVP